MISYPTSLVPTILSRTRLSLAVTGLCGALVGPAFATEGGHVRELLGAPSFEMTTPLLPGWYGQIWYQNYRSKSLRGNDGKQATSSTDVPGVGTIPLTVEGSVKANVAVTRITYVSEAFVLDGRLGFSITAPAVQQTTTMRLVPTFPAGLPQVVVDSIQGGLAAEGANLSGKTTGMADPEFSAFVDFARDDTRVMVGAAVNAPFGDYDKMRAVNPGSGKYWTLKPTLVVSRSWESGFEAGVYATYAFNSANRDTNVRSGQYVHADWSALLKVTDPMRIGLQGYVLKQVTNDHGPGVDEGGNKGQAVAAGPVFAYIADSGRWGIDAKLVREFAVRNRPLGTTSWLRLNLRLD